MSEWISVKDRLPTYDCGEEPTYDWVLVSNGEEWCVARYGHKNINGNLIPSWEFWDEGDEVGCPYGGDSVNTMRIEDIKFWFDVWETIPVDGIK